MIEKFDQIFPANVRWAMLALILVAILVAIEGIWKPARRFWQWVIAPPTCDNCGGTEFRLQPGWTPEMLRHTFRVS